MPQKRPVQEDILPRRQIHIKTGSKLDQRGDASVHMHGAFRGLQDTCDRLEHSTLTAPVQSDQPQGISLHHLEGHVPQRPEFLKRHLVLKALDHVFLKTVKLLGRQIKLHGYMLHLDHHFVTHIFSPNILSYRFNIKLS